MFDVEIRVAGALDSSWISRGIPGFTAEPASPVTMIRGVLAPGEDVTAVLNVLARHGVLPIDLWVDAFPEEG